MIGYGAGIRRSILDQSRIGRVNGYPSILKYKCRNTYIPNLFTVIEHRACIAQSCKHAHIADILAYVYIFKLILPPFDLLMNKIAIRTSRHSINLDHIVLLLCSDHTAQAALSAAFGSIHLLLVDHLQTVVVNIVFINDRDIFGTAVITL